jgi:exosortase/archaeosortase family protein
MKRILETILRYLILILVAIPNLYIFYLIFTPLTIYPIFFLLSLFYEVSLSGNVIFVKELALNLNFISSCIAGSAYYLLFILNLSISNIKIKKRISMIFYSFAILLVFNILRILILISMHKSSLFDITHQFFWYFLSTIFVIAIWYSELKIFKIKQIPFYNDFKFLYKQIK